MGARRIAHIAARRIVAALVLEDAVQHQNLLAAGMAMGGKGAAGGVAHDGGGAGFLPADAEQHAPLHPRCGTGHPGLRSGMDHGADGEIVVQQHRRS